MLFSWARLLPSLLCVGCATTSLAPPKIPADDYAARLEVRTKSEARVYVDGLLLGSAPFEKWVRLEPGPYRLDVRLDGYRPFVRTLELEPRQVFTLDAELQRTPRRVGSLVLLGGGAIGIVTGIVFGAMATGNNLAAASLDSNLDAAEIDDHAKRSASYAVVAAFGAGVGFGLSLAGGSMFVLDTAPKPQRGKAILRLTPGLPGVTLTVRF